MQTNLADFIRDTPEGREAVRAELRRLHELTQNGDKLTSEWN